MDKNRRFYNEFKASI